MLVPDDVRQPSFGPAERIDWPGATTSGLRRSETGVGPAAEKPAITGAAPDDVAPTVIESAELPGDASEPEPVVAVVVAGGDDGDDARRRRGVERERDEVARRLDLGLADREVDHVHSVGDGRLDRGDDLGRVPVEPYVRVGRDRQRLVVAEQRPGCDPAHPLPLGEDVGVARGDAGDVRPVTGLLRVERLARVAPRCTGGRERPGDDHLRGRVGLLALREAGGHRETRGIEEGVRLVEAVVDDPDLDPGAAVGQGRAP